MEIVQVANGGYAGGERRDVQRKTSMLIMKENGRKKLTSARCGSI